MLKFALDGLGIIRVHHYAVEDYLKDGRLKKVMKRQEEIPLYVAYPKRRFVSSKVRCFIDFFAGKMPPLGLESCD